MTIFSIIFISNNSLLLTDRSSAWLYIYSSVLYLELVFVSKIYILREANMLEAEYNHNFEEKEPRTRVLNI